MALAGLTDAGDPKITGGAFGGKGSQHKKDVIEPDVIEADVFALETGIIAWPQSAGSP